MSGSEKLDELIHKEIAYYRRVKSIARSELGHNIPDEVIIAIYLKVGER